MEKNNTWDYLVIGGGHNGFSAACRLAQEKASVLVIERMPRIGGLSASHNYLPEAPHHVLSIGAMDDMFLSQTPLGEDLQLRLHGYESIALQAPYGWVNEEGDTLLLFHQFEKTLTEIAYFSPQDAKTYQEIQPALDWLGSLQSRLGTRAPSDLSKRDLLKVGLDLILDRKLRRLMSTMLSCSAFELISQTFESEAMRGLWAFWTGMIAPGDMDGTGVYISAFSGVHRGVGVQRPKGGMTALMRAFQSKLEALGGQVLLNRSVQRILVERGRATGVILSDGTTVKARCGVLAACAPQIALGELLEDDVLDRKVRDAIRYMPANVTNVGPFKIDMAVGGRLEFKSASSQRKRRDDVDLRNTTLMTGTLEAHGDQLRALRLGRNIDNPPVYMSILSAVDGSISPPGQDVLYLHSNVPVEPLAGWPAEKQRYSDAIRGSAKRYLSGMEAEIGAIESSPLDLAQRFSTPRGCYFHVDMLPTRIGANRPATGLGHYATPVAGLYLAGAGSHPGGGVSGWPGRLAAEKALRGALGSG